MTGAVVVPVEDEASLKRELQAAAEAGLVACVLFRAGWAENAGSFGEAQLAALAALGSRPRCLHVDLGSEEGEQLAMDLGIGSKLPVVRLYASSAEACEVELVGDRCTWAAVEDRVVALGRRRSGKDGGIRDSVRAAYATTAVGGTGVLPTPDVGNPQKRNKLLGYGDGDVNESADLGLGCGNPLLAARLQPGETVLDLGSGAGIDCFIAGREVGPSGHVVGVDMTPDMLTRARATARKDGVTNVSFRLGEIEHLPVGDEVVDCVISNCVINLSPDKPQVYREMNRVLVPGGRLSISDVLREQEIPKELQTVQSYSCWVAGASAEDEMTQMLAAAGFENIRIDRKENAADIIKDWMPGSGAENYITSAYVTASKPIGKKGFVDNVRADSNQEDVNMSDAMAPSDPSAGCWG